MTAQGTAQEEERAHATGSEMRDGLRGEAPQTGGVREVPPAADAGRAQDVVLAADDAVWEDATLRSMLGASWEWHGGPQGADVSSSRRPDDGSSPGEWCTKLE
jgi:hypothetical protein